MLKTALKNYCQRTYSAAMSGEAYVCALGYQLGMADKETYMKQAVLAKYLQKVVFPENLGLIPVAIFTVGVTYRLFMARIGAMAMRLTKALAVKAGKQSEFRTLPAIVHPDREGLKSFGS